MFSIKKVIDKLIEKEKIFVSEADFQLELAWTIKEIYEKEKVDVRLEYCPKDLPNMHIDILVIINNKWIPIELKYKTKKFSKEKIIGEESYNLKEQGARDINCYAYIKDIHRIEKLRKVYPNKFEKGYTIFLTNDLTYEAGPQKENSYYDDFSLKTTAKNQYLKKEMYWSKNTSKKIIKKYPDPLEIESNYEIKWSDYLTVDDTDKKAGKFIYLINEIKNKE